MNRGVYSCGDFKKLNLKERKSSFGEIKIGLKGLKRKITMEKGQVKKKWGRKSRKWRGNK